MKTSHILVTILLAVHATAVHADDDTAVSAFKRGEHAMKAGRIHEACDAFAASEKLAASAETELELASCYEQDGKPMSAAKLYRGAADKLANPDRKQAALAKASKLEARAPKLRFAIHPMPAGLVVQVDGMVVSASEDVAVDTGPHEVIATAPGFQGHASAPVDRERAVLDVIVRMEPTNEPAPAPSAPAAATAPPETAPATATPLASSEPAPAAPGDHRKRNAILFGAAGGAVLVGAIVLFAESSSKFDDAARLCPDSQCASSADLAKGRSLLSDGHTWRDVSIGMGIGGALLVAAGGYFLLAPHKEDSRMSFHLDRDSAGVSYLARF